MKKTFLAEVLEYLDTDRAVWPYQLFIFPTKRAGILFKKAIRYAHPEDTYVFPQIMSITEFIARFGKHETAPELVLLTRLYKEYHRFFPDRSLGQFFPLGRYLLKDFDEIDRYLVSPEVLFRDFELWKNTESSPESEEEMREILRLFRHYLSHPATDIQKGFVALWEAMRQIYHHFRTTCEEDALYYEGLLYRLLAEQGPAIDWKRDHKQLFFCGFFSLSLAEVKIFDYFIQSGCAKIIWDTDSFYSRNPHHESFAAIQKYRKRWSSASSIWLESSHFSSPKEINVYNASYGQEITALAIKLCKTIPHRDLPMSAIIFADESWIQAFLPQLPPQLSGINISMGYKVSYTFYPAYLSMLATLRQEQNGYESLFNHPLTKLAENSFSSFEIEGKIYNSLSREDALQGLTHPHLLALLIGEPNLPLFIENAIALFQDLYRRMQDKEEILYQTDTLVILAIIRLLRMSKEMIKALPEEIPEKYWPQLLAEMLRGIKINFEGDPERGLQAMGFLETRCLDFKNLIILGCNEGLLPPLPAQVSLLPNAIKKVFGLPVMEEHDALTAYHFYRLLQRAEKVDLIFATTREAMSNNEASRYIRQLQYASLENPSSAIVFNEYYTQNEAALDPVQTRNITIPKTKSIRKKLWKYLCFDKAVMPEKYFSPTSLCSYLHCSLHFYYRYVLGLMPAQEINYEMDQRNSGNFFHNLAEMAYPEINHRIDASLLLTLLKSDNIKKIAAEILPHFAQKNNIPWPLSGHDELQVELLIMALEKLMLKEAQSMPYTLLKKEGEIKQLFRISNKRAVALKGKIDRLEKTDEGYRITDYKTGKAKVAAKLPMPNKTYKPENFDTFIRIDSNQHLIQLLLYALLWRDETHTEEPVIPHLYYLQNLLVENVAEKHPHIGSIEFQINFRDAIRRLLKEIFNPAIPFTQTEDLRKCSYCDFKNLCGR